MRVLLAPLFSLALLTACGIEGPVAPEDEDKPCQTDADCEVHGAPTQPRCSSRMGTRGGNMREIDAAACGPMANMTPAPPEPVLACFRGACVPLGSKARR